MSREIDDSDIIFKIITHKKCQVKHIGSRSRIYVDSMVIEMPAQLSKRLFELNKSKKFKLLKTMISQYLHTIDKNF